MTVLAADRKPEAAQAGIEVRPRDIRFDAEPARDRAWLGGDPVGTAVFNALSLTFPDGERLFMDAVRHYRDRLPPKLRAEAQAFIAQEAIHSREHVGLNAMLDRDHYPLGLIEAHLKERLAFLRSRGPVPMLMVTITLEHFTAMMADRFMDEPHLFDGAPEDVARLWRWHAMEETEHKAVAFDVFREISKDWSKWTRYRARCVAMLFTTYFFTKNISRFATMLLMADGEKPAAARRKVFWYLFGKPGLFRRGWKDYWDWFRPGFHPWDHDNRAALDRLRAEFEPAGA